MIERCAEGSAPDEAAIRRKAYELWLERGCPNGSPEEDWREAEMLLVANRKPRYGLHLLS